MRMFTIDPDAMAVRETTVDLSDYRAIQRAIGDQSFELIRPFPRVRLYVDEDAKCYATRPARFVLPREGREPMSLFGKALIVLDGSVATPEIVFPKERRVTSMDHDFRHLGFFVSENTGQDPSNLNFQAILSDERFIAATRVVLATFEPNVVNALPSADFVPMLELEIAREHIGEALDVYDEVVTALGYIDDEDEVEEEVVDTRPNGWAILRDGGHRHSALARA